MTITGEWYILTDGDEVYTERFMTADEALQAQEHARQATDGNIWWCLQYPSKPPAGVFYFKQR